MMSKYKEFYRNEFPFKETVGKDQVQGDSTPWIPSYIIGSTSSGIGSGGNGSNGGSGSAVDDLGNEDFNETSVLKPNERIIIWRTLITLTAKISAPNIIKHPETGKILTYKGKCIKGFEKTYTFVIQAGLIDKYAEHLDCVVMDFDVNGKNYNEGQQDEALTDFFNKGFLEGNAKSEMTIGTKWQEGHFPPEITTIYFKIIDVNANREEVDNIALIKKFRDTVTMKIENRKMTFSKS
jgi:hypothetical protein